jgi:hypothetical protein
VEELKRRKKGRCPLSYKEGVKHIVELSGNEKI